MRSNYPHRISLAILGLYSLGVHCVCKSCEFLRSVGGYFAFRGCFSLNLSPSLRPPLLHFSVHLDFPLGRLYV